MDEPLQPDSPLSKQEQADLANEELKSVLRSLKETKRILARDWEQLSPRERSAYARQVKDLEKKQGDLLEEINLIYLEMG
jgi:hypothetical protein